MRIGTLVVQNLIRGLLPFAFPQSESIIVIVGRKRAILIFKFIPRFFSPHRAPLKSEFDSILVNPIIPSNHLQSILFFVTRVTSLVTSIMFFLFATISRFIHSILFFSPTRIGPANSSHSCRRSCTSERLASLAGLIRSLPICMAQRRSKRGDRSISP